MKKKTAALSFLSICVTLAILLLLEIITPTISGIIFALALLIFGSASRGFRTEQASAKNKDHNAA
jgi:ABC-type dipeptide/oligopeptide/nickel transport system permease subunit